MQTKTLEALLIEANDLVKRLSYDESVDLINNTQTVIIDVREESEVYNLCLLYTSPSPRDRTRSRMPSSA